MNKIKLLEAEDFEIIEFNEDKEHKQIYVNYYNKTLEEGFRFRLVEDLEGNYFYGNGCMVMNFNEIDTNIRFGYFKSYAPKELEEIVNNKIAYFRTERKLKYTFNPLSAI